MDLRDLFSMKCATFCGQVSNFFSTKAQGEFAGQSGTSSLFLS
jgi:hypothetical protein